MINKLLLIEQLSGSVSCAKYDQYFCEHGTTEWITICCSLLLPLETQVLLLTREMTPCHFWSVWKIPFNDCQVKKANTKKANIWKLIYSEPLLWICCVWHACSKRELRALITVLCYYLSLGRTDAKKKYIGVRMMTLTPSWVALFYVHFHCIKFP